MNWMTSGRHRALRSKRGRQRSEMRFPAHVQREAARVRRHQLAAPSPPRDDAAVGPAWYIRPILDANESHDIQMLALAREVASGACEKKDTVPRSEETASATSGACAAGEVQSREEEQVRVEKRCVFTPVKTKRTKASDALRRPVKKTKSPPSRDLLLFNEGEQLSTVPPRASVSSMASAPGFQPTGSSTQSERWLNTPRDRVEHKRALSGSFVEVPFYAASSSSGAEDSEIEDSVSNKRAWMTPRLKLSEHVNEGPWVELQAQSGSSMARNRPSMLEEIDRALATNALMGKEHISHRRSNPSEFGTIDAYHQQSRFQNAFFPEASSYPEQPTRQESPMANENTQELCTMLNASPNVTVHHGHETRGPIAETDGVDPCDDIQKSDSSQESFILPPPVNWQKTIITKYNETLHEATTSMIKNQNQRHDITVGRSGSSRSFSQVSIVDHTGARILGKQQPAQAAWKSSSRTQSIFAKILSRHSILGQTTSKDKKILQLRRQLRKKDAIVIYVHTLVQCHRIDEAYLSRDPQDATTLRARSF